MPATDPGERLTRVTEDDSRVLGAVERRLAHGNPGWIHRAAHVLVIHPFEGTLLLQKRSAGKDMHPEKWDTSVGGHVEYGQSYQEAALREAREELGLHLERGDLEFLYLSRFRGSRESENIATYLCLSPGPFRPDANEISEVRFWARAEIQSALSMGTFTPNFEAEFAAFTASPRGSLLRG